MELHIEYTKKKYGTLHSSGKNHSERRAEAAKERLKPQAERSKRMEDHLELQKNQRADKVRRKQEAAHARAVARKDVAKGIKPSLGRRALNAIREASRKRQEKKLRAERHARKAVRQQAKKTV